MMNALCFPDRRIGVLEHLPFAPCLEVVLDGCLAELARRLPQCCILFCYKHAQD